MTEALFGAVTAQKAVYGGSDLTVLGYYDALRSGKWPLARAADWTTETEDFAPPAGAVVRLASVGESHRSWLYRSGKVLVHVTKHHSGEVQALVAARTEAEAAGTLAAIRDVLPIPAQRDDGTVPVRFWYQTQNGPVSQSRRLLAPRWDEIEGNYSPAAAADVAGMVGPDFEAGAGGRLLLWHGQPGCGKTFALRALCREWSKWADANYVVDPEDFFGHAAYLMSLLLNEGRNDDRWRLIIFEDTGELLSADARTRTGQGLSRLLNTVDGFIGQGLRILILITTNEEIGKLHPAVARPGRCAVSTKFEMLDAPRSAAWAARNGIVVPAGSHSLAELFALRDGTRVEDRPGRIGFASEAAA